MRTKAFLARLMHDVRGATAIEYSLIAALIALGIIGAVQAVGSEVEGNFTEVADKVAN